VRVRRSLEVTGLVQGVGFRPFVHVVAAELELGGFVRNESGLVRIEVEGPLPAIDRFAERIRTESPVLASIETVTTTELPTCGDHTFRIDRETVDQVGSPARVVPPDVATCADCLTEMVDSNDRRHRHPFISCTNCGPRFTIIESVPYDRPRTTMAGFKMCAACAAEYRDPTNRRFHAQTIACPSCGPQLRHDDGRITKGTEAVLAAVQADFESGRIVAIKGRGGYHLTCDATQARTVARLRRRKQRPHKPFAVMVADLETARTIAHVSSDEARALESPARPIVLLRRRDDTGVAPLVAPENPLIGVLLPHAPLHHLLFAPLPGGANHVPRVLVMTSGNRAEEPICHDDADARTRLGPLVDSFCDNDRVIQVPCDDSVVRVVSGTVLPLRRSRGYAPLPIRLPFNVPSTLAVGGELKNTICVAQGDRAWLSQHLGDMQNLKSLEVFERSVERLEGFHGIDTRILAVDAHPGYRTHRWGLRHRKDLELVPIQHHHAHLAALLAEHGSPAGRSVLGFVFDGAGHGTDGQSWGGEVLLGDYHEVKRLAHLRPTPLPGGDAAALNPCRMALAHLDASGIQWAPDLAPVAACEAVELRILRNQLNQPTGLLTTSVGRLFDAVAALLGVRQRVTYEAQAAVELEFLAAGAPRGHELALAVGPDHLDPRPMFRSIVAALRRGVDRAELARGFHRALAVAILETAAMFRDLHDTEVVGLTGGVFQNAQLSGETTSLLENAGFLVLTHRLVPPNDGGLALGQAVVAASRSVRSAAECA
jgi:hydrogenase maturation protein HypF